MESLAESFTHYYYGTGKGHRGLERAVEQMRSGRYDLVVWDEVSTAVGLGLLSVESLLHAVEQRPEGCELVLTGRHYCEELLPLCQLVTNFVEVKHYYHEGVLARQGIEF